MHVVSIGLARKLMIKADFHVPPLQSLAQWLGVGRRN